MPDRALAQRAYGEFRRRWTGQRGRHDDLARLAGVVGDLASADFRRDGLVARAVPIADGTLYMLAQSNQRFDALEHSWRNALEGLPKVAAGSN